MGDKDLSEEWDRKYLERKCQKKKDNYSGVIKARLSFKKIKQTTRYYSGCSTGTWIEDGQVTCLFSLPPTSQNTP